MNSTSGSLTFLRSGCTLPNSLRRYSRARTRPQLTHTNERASGTSSPSADMDTVAEKHRHRCLQVCDVIELAPAAIPAAHQRAALLRFLYIQHNRRPCKRNEHKKGRAGVLLSRWATQAPALIGWGLRHTAGASNIFTRHAGNVNTFDALCPLLFALRGREYATNARSDTSGESIH